MSLPHPCGHSLSEPPAEPFGKDLMALITAPAVTSKDPEETIGTGEMLQSGCGGGCLACKAVKVLSLKSAKVSSELAKQMAPLKSPSGLYTGFFAKGGRTWSMSKRGGARLFVAAGQPQGWVGAGGGCAPSRTNFLLI